MLRQLMMLRQLTMLKQARLRADCFVLPAQNAAVP